MADSGQVEVFVQIGGEDVTAGDRWIRRAGRSQSASFAHRPSYIGRDGAYELDPDLPLRTGQFQTPVGRSLFGAFSDTAPDRWGRKLIERTEAASAREEGRTARSFSDADYLLGVRDDMRQGALRYRRADSDAFLATEDTGVPALLQLGTLLNASEALERDDPTTARGSFIVIDTPRASATRGVSARRTVDLPRSSSPRKRRPDPGGERAILAAFNAAPSSSDVVAERDEVMIPSGNIAAFLWTSRLFRFPFGTWAATPSVGPVTCPIGNVHDVP